MSSLPPIVTSTLLSSVRQKPHLPHHTWYYIAAITLSLLNRPDEIPTVYKHAIDNGPGAVNSKPGFEEQLKISRRMREALVKAGAVGGMPKVHISNSQYPDIHLNESQSINATLALKTVILSYISTSGRL